ncbi:hypothetical protein HPB52_025267 [Rhipicephalus sanguineus]|uniref:Store-operated calcium entry-associated regulatory factor n=1 Tax=Rhipicephalus sanguineus TaxID=34632 RepID=A0A9D4TDA0_RHISA|nr:hypothetical protein HPB52_025267 [Rhipicephalus sanguineus]
MNCTAPFCGRCGTYGHDGKGCSLPCRRCGDPHATVACTIRRSYSEAASKDFPPLQPEDASYGQSPDPASASTADDQVCVSRPPVITIERHAGKKVKLKDVEVLTLRQGQYTTGRRSSPVPQLTCLGGSAGCQNAPAVVQCYNRGSDGYSTQWECKADMSKSQKFGTVEVTCEGYDYADDEYILAGSCGLEYRLEKTGYTAGSTYDSYKHSTYTHGSKSGSAFQMILFLAIAAFIIFTIYRTCLAPGQLNDAPPSYDDGPPPDYPGPPRGGFFGGGGGGGGGMPPPPGFRSQYQTDASCGTARAPGAAGGIGGGGFWTGAAAGGLLGYLLGNTK